MDATDLRETVEETVTAGDNVGERPYLMVESLVPQHLWDAIRADYRSGATLRRCSEIYRVDFSILYRRRKAEAWKQDLKADVQIEVQARLAAESAGLDPRAANDTDTLIEAAATRGASVVSRHRAVLEDTIVAAHVAGRKLKEKLEQVAQRDDVDLAELGKLSAALLNVGNTLARTVPLERLAHGLNEKNEEKPYEDRLREFYANAEAERAARKSARAADRGA